MKKYELTSECITDIYGRKMYRIKALRDFGNIKQGTLGGFIEKEENLAHNGKAWVYDNALVYGNAKVYGNARVYDNAKVHGSARIYGDAEVRDDAEVSCNAEVFGRAIVLDGANVTGDALVYDDARICEKANVGYYAKVFGDASVRGDAMIVDNAEVCGDASVYGNAEIRGDARVNGYADYAAIKGLGSHHRDMTFFRGKNEKIYVACGCFYGDLEEFRTKVKATYHGNNKYAKEYLMAADLMEMHFKKD